MSWKFRARKTWRFGPFFVNVTQSGRRSYGIKLGPITHNFTRSTTSVNTPGPGGFRKNWSK